MRIGFSNKSLWSLLFLQLLSITPLVFLSTIDLSGQSSIGDTVWEDINNNGLQDSGEAGISDIQLELYNDAKQLIQSVSSTSTGFYEFNNVSAGKYFIQLVEHPDFKPTIPFRFDQERNSDVDIVFQKTRMITIDDSVNVTNIDIGLVRKVPIDTMNSIGNFVWHDLNYDGLQQPNEPGIGNITLELINRSKEVISSTVSDDTGAYIFENVPSGNYAIQAKLSGKWNVTKRDFSDIERNSDFDIVFRRTGFIVMDGEQDRLDQDLGLYKHGQITGTVWSDDKNCNKEDGEEFLEGRVVELMNSNGRFIARTTTDSHGEFRFDRLYPDNYTLLFSNNHLSDICVANASTKLVGAFYHISNVEVGSDADVIIDIGCELQEACDWTLEISKQGDSECSDLGFVEIAIIGEVTSEYVISWNHTKERTLTLDALSKGTYTLTITDGDCEKSIDVIINDGLECDRLVQSTRLDLKVFLEGAFDDLTGLMSSTLQESGYLPGLEPKTIFGRKTEAGHPYDRSPWNYMGGEGEILNSDNYYPTNTIDWVLVSLRTDITKESTIFQQAALLLDNGNIVLPQESSAPQLDSELSYYIIVEHRNHMIVMSPYAVPVYDQTIAFDFTANQSYRQLLGHGQKLVKNDRYVMFAGNMEHESYGLSDINYADLDLYIDENGSNSSYITSDLNFDADVNVRDKRLIMDNAGVFTDVPQ